MGRTREFDTDVALAQIADVFWTAGYEATSITDLEEATGLARARLYKAFGPKVEMLHRSIDWYLDGPLERVFRQVDDGGLDGIVRWFALIAALRETNPEKATKGCLVVNSLIELANTNAGVRARGERYRERVLHAFRSALKVAAERGELAGEPEQRANTALMLLLGMFVSIKGGAPVETVAELAQAAMSEVESWRV